MGHICMPKFTLNQINVKKSSLHSKNFKPIVYGKVSKKGK